MLYSVHVTILFTSTSSFRYRSRVGHFRRWCFFEWWNAGQLDLKNEEQERIQKNGTGCLKMVGNGTQLKL